MGWRTVVLSRRAKVEYSMGYMVVRGQEKKRLFMDEVQLVVIATTAVSLTAVWLNECIRRKIKMIFCDERRSPSAELLPYIGSSDSSRQIRRQIEWKEETKARVWQAIIRAKIQGQRQVLLQAGHPEEAAKLAAYREDVEPGDKTNREGHAAKVYFNALWGKLFSRREDTLTNRALNYGYAILLASCNREIAATGYLTQLGIFHDNTFNPFNLGSDFMEPFRPWVDRVVLDMELSCFGPVEKKEILRLLSETVVIDGKKTVLLTAIGVYCHSVCRALEVDEPAEISFPEVYDEGPIHESDCIL